MTIVKLIFWCCFFILFYTYWGFGIFLFLYNKIFKPSSKLQANTPLENWPTIAILVCVHNEEKILVKKIENLLALKYPADKISIIIVNDGSTDGTKTILQNTSLTTVLHHAVRKGKAAAINTAMQNVQAEIVFFSDANALINPQALLTIIPHFALPKVGAVAGEKIINNQNSNSFVGYAENTYWKYESYIKQQEAMFGTLVGATGELLAIRKSLFVPLPEDIVLDDFYISAQVCLQGYSIQYEPNALATETPSASIAEEAKRKIRIAAGAMQAMKILHKKNNTKISPKLIFQYYSRRVLRWIICPFLIFILFISNLLFTIQIPTNTFFLFSLLAQTAFYLMAALGYFFAKKNKNIGPFMLPYYFLFMNLCMLKGLLLFARKKHTVLWEKAARV